jgi:hypothetical protein
MDRKPPSSDHIDQSHLLVLSIGNFSVAAPTMNVRTHFSCKLGSDFPARHSLSGFGESIMVGIAFSGAADLGVLTGAFEHLRPGFPVWSGTHCVTRILVTCSPWRDPIALV